jgi:hypothetical protein
VTTYPYVYDHPDNLPVRASNLERHHGRRLAVVLNPDIPVPGRFNIFDEIGWARALTPATPQPLRHTWAAARQGQNRRPTSAAIALASYTPPPF